MEKVLMNSFQVISWSAIVKYFKNFTFCFVNYNEVSLFDFQSNDIVMNKEKC